MLSDNLADRLNPLKDKALSLVHNATDKASSVDDYIIDSLGNSIKSRTTVWLAHHPFIAWLLNHPLIALIGTTIAIILIVRLLLTVYQAIARAIDRMWLAILRSPFTLIKFIFGWEAKPKAKVANLTVTNYEVTNDTLQLQEIMTRLDLIQQQQQEIIQKLAQLKQQPLTIERQQLRLAENANHTKSDYQNIQT
ncbi:MAG: hypothetical protein AAF652_07520 [Cyanobacteria bacterium P01_C01_bin.72]